MIIGLLAGAGIGVQSADEAVAEARENAETRVAEAEAAADVHITDAHREDERKQQQAIDAAVEAAVAAEVKKRDELIDEAVDAAVREAVDAAVREAEVPSPDDEPQPAIASDPRFDTCRAANAAGYGTYRRGVDVEYDWYQDRDHDGVVCE